MISIGSDYGRSIMVILLCRLLLLALLLVSTVLAGDFNLANCVMFYLQRVLVLVVPGTVYTSIYSCQTEYGIAYV
jgi:hypothetical protein